MASKTRATGILLLNLKARIFTSGIPIFGISDLTHLDKESIPLDLRVGLRYFWDGDYRK